MEGRAGKLDTPLAEREPGSSGMAAIQPGDSVDAYWPPDHQAFTAEMPELMHTLQMWPAVVAKACAGGEC